MPMLVAMQNLIPSVPNEHTITPEQILELRQLSMQGLLPARLQDIAQIAVSYHFPVEERAAARRHLVEVYATCCPPLAALLIRLGTWVACHSFDDDQDPATDTPDEALVRAYGCWRATQ